MSWLSQLNSLPANVRNSSDFKSMQAAYSKVAFDFTREMFTIAKYKEGLYSSPAVGRAALEYARTENQYPDESRKWARRYKGYNAQTMRDIAIVQPRYSKVYYFLLDQAGVVAWTSSKLRSDGGLPLPRKLKYERPTLDAAPIVTQDSPILGDVVEGTYLVKGSVISTKMSRGKASVLLEVVYEGVQFKLFGALTLEMVEKYGNTPNRGTRMEFQADVTQSSRDSGFGFFEPVSPNEETLTKGRVRDGESHFVGAILSVYDHSSQYGIQTKMRVQGEMGGGLVTVSGTVPSHVLRRVSDEQELIGKTIGFTAQFRAGKSPDSGYFSRPKQVQYSGVSSLLENRSQLSKEITDAVSNLVIENPFEAYMVADFDEGEVEIKRTPGQLTVDWYKRTPSQDKYEFVEPEDVLKDNALSDQDFYDFVQSKYQAKVIYKKELNRLLNFDKLFRTKHLGMVFSDRFGVEHRVTLRLVTYPKYKVFVRYDDERDVRIYDFDTLN
jgi:hypothetical protein